MKAVATPESNVTLKLDGAGDDRDLPAQRIQAYDEELGETPEDSHAAILTTWEADDGERRALANGAKVQLVVHGAGHPPVSMGVGDPDPDSMEALLSKKHADQAVRFLLCELGERVAKGEGLGTPDEVAGLWTKALEETKDGDLPVDAGARIKEAQDAVDAAGPQTGYVIKDSLGRFYVGEDDFREERKLALVFSDLGDASTTCEGLRIRLKQKGIEVVPTLPEADGKS